MSTQHVGHMWELHVRPILETLGLHEIQKAQDSFYKWSSTLVDHMVRYHPKSASGVTWKHLYELSCHLKINLSCMYLDQEGTQGATGWTCKLHTEGLDRTRPLLAVRGQWWNLNDSVLYTYRTSGTVFHRSPRPTHDTTAKTEQRCSDNASRYRHCLLSSIADYLFGPEE